MPLRFDHADHVHTVAGHASAAASSPVAASWRRCLTLHGLSPEEARAPWRLTEAEFHHARTRSSVLVEEASGELDRLFATVGKAGCCLLLTDENGIALERRGAAGDDREFRGVGLWSGTVWSEASVGTNGIGTALADERPVLILRDQHFLSQNTGLSCTTAPIRDHTGRIAAAIDISTCRDDANEMTMAILSQAIRDAAARIEAGLFRRAFSAARILLVPVDGRAAPRYSPSIGTIWCSAPPALRARCLALMTGASPRALPRPTCCRRIGRRRGGTSMMPSALPFAVS